MTVAARIQIQVEGHSGQAPIQVQGRTPGAESFRIQWQDQLAFLGGGADGASAAIETEETAAAGPSANRPQPSPASVARLSLPLQTTGAGQRAQAQPAASRASVDPRGRVAVGGTGVPEVVPDATKAVAAAPANAEVRQPAGTSNSERESRSENTRPVPNRQGQAAAGSVSPAAAAPLQIPANQFPTISEALIHTSSSAEIDPPSRNAADSTVFAAGTTGDSLFAAARGFAANGGGFSREAQTAPPARPAEVHSSSQAESRSTGSGNVAAQDSNGIEKPLGGVDGYPAAQFGTPAEGAAAAPIEGMNVPSLATSPETNHAPSATTDAQTAPVQVSGGGTKPVAGSETGSPSNPLAAGEPNQANPALPGVDSASLPATRRIPHAAGATQERGSSVEAHLAAEPGDATAIVRDPAGGRELMNPASGGATAAEPALRETFAALDAEVAPGAPTWTHASSRQAEAGFHDPALGWIGVRADRTGDGIHAALVPGSAEAALELGSHLDGLNAYLTAQHTPVESLGMAAAETGTAKHGGEQASGQGMGQGNQQEAGQGPGQDAGQNAQQQSYAAAQSAGAIHSSERARTSADSDHAVQSDAAAHSQTSGGVYISVVA